MVFNTWEFGVFLAVVLALYYVVRREVAQSLVLILASIGFYVYDGGPLLLVLLLAMAVSFFTTEVLKKTADPGAQMLTAVAGALVCIGLLCVFKYASFFLGGFQSLTGYGESMTAAFAAIPLPLGISYFTLQAAGHILDARAAHKQGHQKFAQLVPDGTGRNLINSSLFISFFPQLVAGPILRSREFMAQIRTKTLTDCDVDRFAAYFITGLCLKMVVADNMVSDMQWIRPPFVDLHASLTLWIMSIAFTVWLYADFCGYSLMAIGIGALFGYRIPENFLYPFLSHTVGSYLRRWHVSIYTWLRDFVMKPLFLVFRKTPVAPLVMVLTMMLAGLWHGPTLPFMVMGGIAGALMILQRPYARWVEQRPLLPAERVLVVLVNMSLMGFIMVFYFAPTIDSAFDFYIAFFNNAHKAVDWTLILSMLTLSIPVALHHVGGYFVMEKKTLMNERARNIALGGALALVILNAGPHRVFFYFYF